MFPPIRFFVPGPPAPGGSKTCYRTRHGRLVVVDAAPRNKSWRALVAAVARRAYAGPPLDEPLRVVLAFVLPRPKAHHRGGRRSSPLRPGAPPYPAVRPDALKLARAVEDALTGIVWRDDCLTVALHVLKCYGDRPGVLIRIAPATAAAPPRRPRRFRHPRAPFRPTPATTRAAPIVVAIVARSVARG